CADCPELRCRRPSSAVSCRGCQAVSSSWAPVTMVGTTAPYTGSTGNAGQCGFIIRPPAFTPWWRLPNGGLLSDASSPKDHSPRFPPEGVARTKVDAAATTGGGSAQDESSHIHQRRDRKS